jgi:DNA helicase-2/ATP-dependent DNA helicase PcrA
MFGRTVNNIEPSIFLSELDKKYVKIIGQAPYSFYINNFSENLPNQFSNKDRWLSNGKGDTLKLSSKNDSSCQWNRGDKIFHDDFGYGEVLNVKDSDNGTIIRIQFETGKEMSFLSEHQKAKFVKIKKDDF